MFIQLLLEANYRNMIESGATQSSNTVEYKFKDKEGNLHSEVIRKKNNKLESHTMDGKEMIKEEKKEEISEETKEAPQGIQFTPGNADYCQLVSLNRIDAAQQRIAKQLIEINYYLAKAHGDDSDKERIEKLING